MKNVLAKIANREIVDILDSGREAVDWICKIQGERTFLLSQESLETCDCGPCDREAKLRFWVAQRRLSES